MLQCSTFSVYHFALCINLCGVRSHCRVSGDRKDRHDCLSPEFTISLPAVLKPLCRNAGSRGCGLVGTGPGECIAGPTTIHTAHGVKQTHWQLHRHTRMKSSITYTKDPLSLIISISIYRHLSTLIVIIDQCGQCGGLTLFFLKSGSAISTNNACFCPLMQLALILIRSVLLSTSSFTSLKKRQVQETHDEKAWGASSVFIIVHLHFSHDFYFLFSFSGAKKKKKHRNFEPTHKTVGCHFLPNVSSRSRLPVCELVHRSGEEWKLWLNPPFLWGETIQNSLSAYTWILRLHHSMIWIKARGCKNSCSLRQSSHWTQQAGLNCLPLWQWCQTFLIIGRFAFVDNTDRQTTHKQISCNYALSFVKNHQKHLIQVCYTKHVTSCADV